MTQYRFIKNTSKVYTYILRYNYYDMKHLDRDDASSTTRVYVRMYKTVRLTGNKYLPSVDGLCKDGSM